MSGVLVIPNQFQAAVTATGLQLDTDFNSVTAYINDPTNRNNYVADSSGATNTVNLTFSPPVAGAYSTGLDLTWKWANTNSGATVVNANGLGQASLVNPDGSALVPGQGVVGSIGHGASDGTRFIYLTPPSPATPAAVSAAVTLAPYVSPGTMQNHSGVAKAWASWNGTATGTITPLASYNITSIVNEGSGSYALTITTPFSSFNYALAGSVSGRDTGARFLGLNELLTSNSATVHIITTNDSGGASLGTYVAAILFGAQ